MKNVKLSALAIAVGLVSTHAIAQEAPGTEIEEVVVTGSRITDPNVVSSSHISSVSGADIQERGITRVEDFLNDLPQISPGQAITSSNGSDGTATVNLRNLGCSRTLVLVNGKRMAPGSTGGSSCADLNAIPSLLVERVEVLTGGASSVYGSDAVAGVVNFILDDEFEGFKASYTHSFYQHENDDKGLRNLVESYDYDKAPGDITTGYTDKLAVAFGGSIFEGRGHVTAYIEKTLTDPILQGEYDISACALSGGTSRCGGSSTIPPGRWADFGAYTAGGFVNVDPTVTGLDLKVQGDEFVPRAGQTYNYNPTNFFQRPDDRLNTGFFGKFEINEFAEAYASIRSMKSESNAQIAYSGTFGNITSIPCYNPLLSEQQYQVACSNWVGMGGDYAPDFATSAEALAYISGLDLAVGDGDILGYNAPLTSLKRNVEGGARQAIFTYENLVQTFGVRGDLNDRWSYDVSYQVSTIDFAEEYRNDLSVAAINKAMNVVSVAGTPTCVSALTGADSSCIPYNLFSGGLPGDQGIQAVIDGGQALQNYIANATTILGTGKERILSAYVSGDTGIAIPGAPSAISIALGYETRETTTDYRPDLANRTGDRSGSGGAALALKGGYDVDEYYMELGIPVTTAISLDAGYRTSEYSTGQDTESYKLGAFWRVNDQIAVRTAFQTATRHANIAELFESTGFDLVDLDDDPCGLSQTASQAACANTGLPANLYGTDLKSPADQYNILSGGNPNVAPEEAESFTAGIVLTPTMLEGLTLTIDYFDINVTDGIGSVSAKTALDKCLTTGQATYCNLINRNPVNGSLWLTGGYISAQTTNIAEETTQGIDIIFDYSMETPLGVLELEGVTTYLSSFEIIELPGEAAVECAGNWGGSCGKNPLPEWSGNYKATLVTAYDTNVSLGMRYLGETDDLNSNGIDFDSYTYFDLTAVYSPTENYTATIGISNLFDKDPAVTSDAGTAPGNGNTFPAYFDALGRYMYFNLSATF
mgnify:CR=1 FL=1